VIRDAERRVVWSPTPVEVGNAQGGETKMEQMRGTRNHMAESASVIPAHSDPRVLLIAGLGLTAVAVTLALPAIHQWGSYHNFADTRGFRYLPNAFNVLSNVPFLIVGALGLASVSRPSPSFLASWERGPAAVLMFALFLTAFGSAYYHWNPNDRSLFSDRLPLELLFRALLASRSSSA
jgi:hypothetical protein